ncbi:MAG: OmpH family outer membrane protein [Bdellovibrio sp.]|nr:OmpH family outer membrane protein [Bdellovibrio sp.]
MTKSLKLLVLFVCVMGLQTAWAEVSVGKVDIQKVLITVKQGQDVREKLKKNFDGKQEVIKKEEDAIRKLQEDYQKQQLVMNDKARVEKEKEIQDKIMALQQKTMGYQKEIQQMEQTLKRPILEKLRDVIADISKKESVDVTFEASTAPVVYAKNEKDLTDAVITEYNKRNPK